MNKDILLNKIKKQEAVIGVLGLGYVGLPMVKHMLERNYPVTGFDVSTEKVDKLNNGISYIDDISNQDLQKMQKKQLKVTTNPQEIATMDVIFICVPTPIDSYHKPDLTFIEKAMALVLDHVTPNTLIILESTTYPGTTQEFIATPLEEKGFTVGEDIFVAYSPERIDPGNENYNLDNTSKIVGGMTKNCTELASNIIGKTAVVVSNVQTAELTKIFENTFRWVNIALSNEMAQVCNSLDIDVFEMINGAGTKPYGFMQFNPGIGVGGHCIPVDPFYLTHIMERNGRRVKMIDAAASVNNNMSEYIYYRILENMNQQEKLLKKSNIVILGATYKENVSDFRESPVLDLIKKLEGNVNKITVIEPSVNITHQIEGVDVLLNDVTNEILATADLVVVGTAHSSFNWEHILENSPAIFDTKNVFEGSTDDKIMRL